MKILLVDTDKLHMKALQKRIALHMQAEVICISTYQEVLSLPKEEIISVAYIAMDISHQKAGDIIRHMYYTYPTCRIVMMLNKETQAVNQMTMKYSGIGYLYKPFSWDDFYKWIPAKGMTKEKEVTGKSLDLLEEIVQGFQQGDFEVAYDRLYQVCQYTYEHSDSQSIASELYELVDQVQHKVLDTHILKLHTMVSKIQLEPVHTKYAEGLAIWTFKIVDFLFMKLYQGKQEILHNVLYYIHTHIQEDISLKDIVVSCNVSQGYISRIFKHKLNMTIMQYIHKKKINLAKEYILGTEKSGSYIANILGYSDVSYFCKIFKKHEHKTISQYRDQVINGLVETYETI